MLLVLFLAQLLTQPAPAAPDPFSDRVEADRRRMATWPRSRELSNGWLSPPSQFIESTFVLQAGMDWRKLDDSFSAALYGNAELVFRVGHHLGRGHIVGLTLLFMAMDDGVEYDWKPYEPRQIVRLYNPTLLFYRYAFPGTPLSAQVEPLRMEWSAGDRVDHGVRFSFQVVKNTTPMRLGLELHLDVTTDLVRPTLTLVWGYNF